ncbi:MAG TPA: hypothetical protein VH328_04320 [Burkholderiaceae bacterium]|nr:hypothetical protein [Burkholderiaceae bacterium]
MRDDALPLRRVVGIGVVLAAVVAGAIGVVVLVLAHRTLPLGGVPVSRPAPLARDLPMLQSAPQVELAAYRREKAAALESLGWVDAASGVAHIPIAAAMDLLMARSTDRGASAPEGVR